MLYHTPEPWIHHISKSDGRSFVVDRPVDEQPWLGNLIVMHGTNIRAREDHARIVACVNACAGMKDPAQSIALARAALKRAAYSLSVHGATKDLVHQCSQALESLGA